MTLRPPVTRGLPFRKGIFRLVWSMQPLRDSLGRESRLICRTLNLCALYDIVKARPPVKYLLGQGFGVIRNSAYHTVQHVMNSSGSRRESSPSSQKAYRDQRFVTGHVRRTFPMSSFAGPTRHPACRPATARYVEAGGALRDDLAERSPKRTLAGTVDRRY